MASYALKKRPRTTTRALSECVSIMPDGTRTIMPSTRVSSAMSDAEKLKRAKQREQERKNAKIDAQNAIDARKFHTYDARFGVIGNID